MTWIKPSEEMNEICRKMDMAKDKKEWEELFEQLVEADRKNRENDSMSKW